jgi:hypothetical protein
MSRTVTEKRSRATRQLEGLREKRERHGTAVQSVEAANSRRQLEAAVDDSQRTAWTEADSAAELGALETLAEVNEKSMSVEDARAWAAEFVLSHPDASEWAWRFVGRVEVHQQSRRGPKPTADMEQVDLIYDPIVKAAARTLGLKSRALSQEEVNYLLERTNGLAQDKLLERLSRSQLRMVMLRVLPVR